jgi:hypothetical protein
MISPLLKPISSTLWSSTCGPDTPYLVRDLIAEARALRKLARDDEAAKLERRTPALPSAGANPN